MIEQPRLSDALAGLAGAPRPPLDASAVADRARVLRRRRAAALGSGGVAGIAVIALVVSLASGGDRRANDIVVVTSDTPTPASSGEPTTEATPDPTATPAVVAPSSPPASVATGPAHSDPTPSPSPAGTFAPPGLRIVITQAPQNPATGQLVDITVRVTDTDGSWVGGSLSFGDGTSLPFPSVAYSCVAYEPGKEPAPDYRPQPSDSSEVYRHRYARAGTYAVSVTARTLAGGCTPHQRQEEKTQRRDIVVTGADQPSNGPATPVVSASDWSQSWQVASGHVEANVSAGDNDGRVHRLVVDWGDGSPATVLTNDAGCTIAHHNGWSSGGGIYERVSHDYASSATFTVTMTATSVGCAGDSEQSTTEEFTVSPD